jgi:hypothetical protein
LVSRSELVFFSLHPVEPKSRDKCGVVIDNLGRQKCTISWNIWFEDVLLQNFNDFVVQSLWTAPSPNSLILSQFYCPLHSGRDVFAQTVASLISKNVLIADWHYLMIYWWEIVARQCIIKIKIFVPLVIDPIIGTLEFQVNPHTNNFIWLTDWFFYIQLKKNWEQKFYIQSLSMSRGGQDFKWNEKEQLHKYFIKFS